MAQEDRWKKPGMTRWYDFSVLAMTSTRKNLSRALGAMIDTRRFTAPGRGDADSIHSYTDHAGDFWFDYVADIGDSWNATYTLACLLSSNTVTPLDKPAMPRGQFLFMGGDEVYPFASREQYARRLVWPFKEAARALSKLGSDGATRDLYCLPGNHDWYDSLASFTRRFCNRRTIGSFQTQQACSYFVLKLPHNWQLWAADLQLHSDIDIDQVEFFRRHASTLNGRERIILCIAEPDWVYGQVTDEDLHNNAGYLERLAEASGAQVRVHLAGDLHNYQRYEGRRTSSLASAPEYSQTKLVSGGGGAFLHPTPPDGTKASDGGELKKQYPSPGQSRWLSLRLLLFMPLNWQLSSLFGIFYLVLFWSVPGETQWSTAPLAHPGVFLLVFLVACVLVGSVEVLPRWSMFRKALTKSVWGMAHLAGHLALAWQTWRLAEALAGWLGFNSGLAGDYIVRALVLPLGTVLGGTLLGLYLFLSFNLLRIHENDAFAALRISRFKHFLRCRLTPDALSIYVLATPETATAEGRPSVPVHCIEEITIRP